MASVTVTEYVPPAHRAAFVLVLNVPPVGVTQAYVYGPTPPEGAAVTEPVQVPQQVKSTLDITTESAETAGTLTLVVEVQAFLSVTVMV